MPSPPPPSPNDRPADAHDGGLFVGLELATALRSAGASSWSGAFELSSGNHLVAGTAVLHRGLLAWATSMHQPETLGSFLHRLGHVTRDELDIAQALYDECKGEKKLGRLLEEAGIIPRQVLRRCILLHVRLAVVSLLQKEHKIVSAHPEDICVEQEMLFPLQEVLPEWRDAPIKDLPGTGPSDAVTAVLESIKTVPGHRGCLVADRHGRAVATRGFSATAVPGPSVLGTTAVTLLEGASHAATWSSLGSVEYASSEGSNGSLLAHWLDQERSLLAVVLLEKGGKLGIARHELSAAASSFSKHLSKSTQNGS